MRPGFVACALAVQLVSACSRGTPRADGSILPPFDGAAIRPDGGAFSAFCDTGQAVPSVAPPSGFCIRLFAHLREPRTLALAPNGDVVVGAPSTATPGGASGGPGAILVLADDNADGVAEAHVFARGLPDVHGVAIGDGYLYFTTQEAVWRTPYTAGQRAETGPREKLAAPARFGSGGRWTHGLARSAAGRLLASRGEYASCGNTPGGEISALALNATSVLATGFRNPMYIRCHPRDEICAATELGEDLTAGAREKLVLVRPQTDYGYPCCFTTNLPAVEDAGAGACGAVQPAEAEFPLSDTPFGLDWERGVWPEPYAGALFVALHGSFYSNPPWQGARIVFARVDPQTRAPVEGWRDFLLGFGPQGTPLERPADVVFGDDGRLFFADDQGGAVYWIAPLSLTRQARPN